MTAVASRIVLAKTRHHYDSYVDFWRLAEAAGLEACFVDEIDLARGDTTYVFTPYNGELPPLIERSKAGRRAKLVWWNLERPADETLPATLDQLAGALDAIWVSDRSYAAVDPRFTYVPIAGHRAIAGGTIPHDVVAPTWDVCPLAYLWGRRETVCYQLGRRGYRIAPPAYGKVAQDAVIPNSALVLNLHQYEGTQTIAPLRFAIAASYAVPIVSEEFADAQAMELVLAAVPIGAIVSTVGTILKMGWTALKDHGQRLYQQQCIDTDFGIEIERAAAELWR